MCPAKKRVFPFLTIFTIRLLLLSLSREEEGEKKEITLEGRRSLPLHLKGGVFRLHGYPTLCPSIKGG